MNIYTRLPLNGGERENRAPEFCLIEILELLWRRQSTGAGSGAGGGPYEPKRRGSGHALPSSGGRTISKGNGALQTPTFLPCLFLLSVSLCLFIAVCPFSLLTTSHITTFVLFIVDAFLSSSPVQLGISTYPNQPLSASSVSDTRSSLTNAGWKPSSLFLPLESYLSQLSYSPYLGAPGEPSSARLLLSASGERERERGMSVQEANGTVTGATLSLSLSLAGPFCLHSVSPKGRH